MRATRRKASLTHLCQLHSEHDAKVQSGTSGTVIHPASTADMARWEKKLMRSWPLNGQHVVHYEMPPGKGKLDGMCESGGNGRIKHEIWVSDELDRSNACATLMHEWTHAYRWERDPDRASMHDDLYWVFFGRLYRGMHRTT